MNGFFSIRTKFLTVIGALLLTCVVVYLLIAVQVFKTDKTELVFDLNRSMVSNLSAELETQFVGVSDKFKLFALLSAKPSNQAVTDNLFDENSDIVFVSIYRQSQTQALRRYENKKYLETYGIDKTFFEVKLAQDRPVPFSEILKNGEYFWNASVESGVPLIGYGRSVVVEDEKGQPTDHLAVIGYVKPDKILKALSYVKLSEVTVVDHAGRILIHPDFEAMKQNRSFISNPLFQSAVEAKVNLSVVSLKDADGEFLGAFARAYNGQFYVLARASKDKAFSAVYELVSRSLSFALIVMTLSLLFAFLLSRSLTQPISILVDGMQKVSDGDLNTQIDVRTNDETKMLASSFNQMITDLKQSRDELQEINRELDKKVKERTVQLEIQNKAVKEAQEALLKTTRLASAGEIAGRAAHEVLNPLTGILTRLSSVEKKLQGQVQPQINLMRDIFDSWKADHSSGGFEKLVTVWQQKSEVEDKWNMWHEDMNNLSEVSQSFETMLKNMDEDTQFLLQEGRRIGKIIGSMRKLSRLNSDVQTHSVRKLLIDCRNIMADLFNQEGIELKEDFKADTDEINIDRDEFIQVITNLMRNSLQAINKSKAEQKYYLKIITRTVDDKIQIELVDNGFGVPEMYQSYLFEQQFTTKSADEGTGLGLGISRRLIRAHGGDIEFVSSKPYQETKFKITLPLKNANNSIEEGAA